MVPKLKHYQIEDKIQRFSSKPKTNKKVLKKTKKTKTGDNQSRRSNIKTKQNKKNFQFD